MPDIADERWTSRGFRRKHVCPMASFHFFPGWVGPPLLKTSGRFKVQSATAAPFFRVTFPMAWKIWSEGSLTNGDLHMLSFASHLILVQAWSKVAMLGLGTASLFRAE